MSEFVHLHLHTAYSLLDGAIKIPELMSRVKEFGMQAVAITDHGTMAGVIDFYQQARKHEIKAILGIEIYVARSDRQKREKENNHLVLLARNITGYRNLLYLSSMAHREGFYYKPRIDLELLRERREGLIGLSACLAGQIPQLILGGKYEQAAEAAKTLADIFEPGGFYLELQENGLPEQATVNNALMKLARELGLPLVATNDCHYLNRDDATAHEVLMCVQTGKKLSDEHRLHHTTDAFYVKSPEEMKSSFSYAAEAVRNSLRIAEACNVELDLGHNYLPRFEVPEGFSDLPAYLRHLAEQGLERRFAESRQPLDRVLYGERLTHELSVIVEMGFTGYFLIVWEFIDYAKRNDIPVGPGRGSGAGSLVAFALRITDIDPIKYNLLFERFLNPERISMPDFDVDFCQDKRELVIKHVTEKYGVENVAQIATFGVLKARAVLKDVGRVLDFSFKDMNDLSKLVPEDPKMTLEKALKESPDFAKFYQDDHYRHLIDISMRLEGLNRHMGIHAAGVVIADKPIWEYVPIWVKDGKDLVSQFAKDEVEQAGLVKFDFLGLKTLTLLAGAVRRIRQRPGEEGFTVEALPLEDAATFALLSSGKTVGVFQVESQGFMELLRGLRPDTLEDIIAAVALYRPGPLGSGMDKDFIRRKHGEEPIVYPHPLLEGVLKETYGVIIYQEQVMQIVQILAGYTLGGADILRRAMGKKKADLMAQHRKVFVDGCLVKNIEERNATEIFDLLEKFADYGFNKSHSAAYALITYQTAYLKCHYPLEFMAALLTTERNDTDKVTFYINEVKDMGGRVLPPDVNRSEEDFTVEQGAIR
ncbi:MAG: DNA polymerase III subunit alpha, partial [Deltaproteobacteria bacterium RIFOXYA12_FULL_61_11]